MIYQFTKDILSDKLIFEIAAAGLSAPKRVDTVGTSVSFVYENALSAEDEAKLNQVVTNHVKITTVEGLTAYLDSEVFPFVKQLINNFAAENIAMGITQSGKTADVLGLFEKKVDIGALHPVSLKSSFDTGSLYVSIAVIQFFRNNSAEFSGLSPFVTDSRLLAMKNKIEAFLGLPLSS